MAHVPRPGATAAAVWICEYPYRTMRIGGPSSECDDCPVWQARQHGSHATSAHACAATPAAGSNVVAFNAPQAS